MTVKDLRTLVDNLDEYIHIPGGIERIKKTILHLAVSGKLVPQKLNEGTSEELYQQIQKEKVKLITEGKLKKQKPLPEITEDEIPFEIPESWKWVRLGDVTNYGSSKKLKPSEIKPGTWLLELEDIEKVTSRLIERIDSASRNTSSDKNVFHKGDVLYGKLRPYLDKVILADDDGVCTTEILPVRTPRYLVLPDYIRFFMKSPKFISAVNEITYGVKMPRLGTEDGRSMLFPLPGRTEQERITSKIKDCFALIDELEQKFKTEQAERSRFVKAGLSALALNKGTLVLNDLTGAIKTKDDANELRKTILHLAVSGKLVPQDPSEGTGEELYQQIQAQKQKLIFEGKLKNQKPLPEITEDEIPFEIPESWKWVKLGELANYRKGPFGSSLTKAMFVPKSNDAVKVYEQKNAIKKDEKLGNYYITRDYYETKMKGFSVGASDIIVSCAGTIGEIFILPSGSPTGIINQALMRIRLFTPMNKRFYITCLDKAITLNKDKAMGIAIKNIPPFSVLNNIPIPLPPLDEQERIFKKSTELLDLVAKIEKQLEN